MILRSVILGATNCESAGVQMVVSLNFAFLASHDPQLVRLGGLAEQYFASDPNTCLIKLRQFGELLAQLAALPKG